MISKINYMFLITSIHISLSLCAMDECQNDLYEAIEIEHNGKLNSYINIRAGLSEPFGQLAKYNDKLLHLELGLRQKEQEILEDIQKLYSPNQMLWERCMNVIEKLKTINRENKNKPLSDFVQDKNLPYVFTRMLSKEARKNEVNLERIHIQHDYNFSRFLLTGYPCIANCSIKEENDKKYIAINADNITPGQIKLNMDLFVKRNVEDKRIACIYLLEPIIQEFACTYTAIEMFEQLYLSSAESILESKEYKKLRNFHVQLCALLPSLRSRETAMLMKSFHGAVQAKELLELANYDYLCKINRYWDIITWLKTYACTKNLSL